MLTSALLRLMNIHFPAADLIGDRLVVSLPEWGKASISEQHVVKADHQQLSQCRSHPDQPFTGKYQRTISLLLLKLFCSYQLSTKLKLSVSGKHCTP